MSAQHTWWAEVLVQTEDVASGPVSASVPLVPLSGAGYTLFHWAL